MTAEPYSQEFFTEYAGVLRGLDEEELAGELRHWQWLLQLEEETLDIINLAQSEVGPQYKKHTCDMLTNFGNCVKLINLVRESRG